jgi:hypothetical protein
MTGDRTLATDRDVYSIAYLAGGSRRAVETAVVDPIAATRWRPPSSARSDLRESGPGAVERRPGGPDPSDVLVGPLPHDLDRGSELLPARSGGTPR